MAKRDAFVRSVRALERLKSNESFADSVYEEGKYILFLKSELVCTEENERLAYRNYTDIVKFKKYGESRIILLDIVHEPKSQVCLLAIDVDIPPETDVKKVEAEVDGSFIKIRHSLYFLNFKDSQYVTHAKGLLHFCKTHNFCVYCGGSLTIKEGGFQKSCPDCQTTHYPNLCPVGLTLVEDESHQQVLLVRQQRHPPGMYTCVAGFIEPGESLEQNVKREVAEEVGLEVQSIEYCMSQHWALPSCQLTLGCIATSRRKDTDIDSKEILDAKWVDAEDLKGAVMRIREIKNLADINDKVGVAIIQENAVVTSLSTMKIQKLWAPPRNAVSHNLMVAWLKKYHQFELPPNS